MLGFPRSSGGLSIIPGILHQVGREAAGPRRPDFQTDNLMVEGGATGQGMQVTLCATESMLPGVYALAEEVPS